MPWQEGREGGREGGVGGSFHLSWEEGKEGWEGVVRGSFSSHHAVQVEVEEHRISRVSVCK